MECSTPVKIKGRFEYDNGKLFLIPDDNKYGTSPLHLVPEPDMEIEFEPRQDFVSECFLWFEDADKTGRNQIIAMTDVIVTS